ncbi:MAG: hypothetical protein JO348_04730 [Alphaproteobacteria bacterium]|nr:hypothetical protein [Alphaproteobacteria bacterium]
MTLADIAAISSAISGIAVVASLVFLYFQVRQVGEQVKQAEKNQQAAIRQGRTNRIVEIKLAILEPGIAEAVAKGENGDENITSLQLAQFKNYLVAHINHLEDSFYQHEDGLLPDSAFETVIGGARGSLAKPGYRAGWRTYEPARHGAFAAFMEKLIAETPLAAQSDDPLASWRKLLAEVRASAAKP